MTDSIAERDICKVELDKVRFCVVIAVSGDDVTVVYGQGKPGDQGSIFVRRDSDMGRRAKLDKDTHFREGNVAIVKLSQVGRKIAVCPRRDFLDFQDLAGRFMKKRAQSTGSGI